MSRKNAFEYLPVRLRAALERLGDGSYSLYLVHMFIVRLVTKILPTPPEATATYVIAYYAIMLPTCIVVADLLYRHVELGIMRLYQGRMRLVNQ